MTEFHPIQQSPGIRYRWEFVGSLLKLDTPARSRRAYIK
jgi:hypothetical protein